MSLQLALLKFYFPPQMKKRGLEELCQRAARGFSSPFPYDPNSSYEGLLNQFAQFSLKESQKAIDEGRGVEVKKRLFNETRQMGENLKFKLRLSSFTDVLQALRLIYGTLKIDFHGGLDGQITINSCYFSKYFSPQICEVVSGLDEGLIFGLSGGMRLKFSGRLTQNETACRAQLEGKEAGV